MKQKKKELLEFGNLEVSDEIVSLAEADVPRFDSKYKKNKYKHEIHLCTKAAGNLMAVFLFMTENLRMGGKKPAYIIFLDREAKDFITYDTVYGKWRQAVLGRLFHTCNACDKIFIAEKEQKALREFLHSEKGESSDIHYFQLRIRDRQLAERHKKETDPWDQEMKEVPKLPEDWEHWLTKSAVKEHFIFYQYKRKVREGYCSWCERKVPISEPRHNKMGRCPKCRRKIQYKAIGRAGTFYTKEDAAYIFQKCGRRIILRQFSVRSRYISGQYDKPELLFWENQRFFLDDTMQERAYYYGCYKNVENRWIRFNKDGKVCRRYSYPLKGEIYRRTLPSLNRTFMKRTGLYEMLRYKRRFDPVNYLAYQITYPYLERLVKAGLEKLSAELFESGKEISVGERGELGKCLKIDRQLLGRLRRNHGGIEYLCWLQMEKRQGKPIEDQLIAWFSAQNIYADDISFIEDRMSAQQVSNYLLRNAGEMRESCKQVLITWKDYISMAGRLGMDVHDEIIYRTSKLKKRHEEAVALLEKKNMEEAAAKMSEKFPKVDEICKEIKEKYEYLDDEKYAVLVPDGIYDVMQEGRRLHHCVGNEDRYYDRINRQESYILFLREKKELQKAYYTLEVEPGGTIRQKRKEYDRQGKEIEELTVFLKKWQEVVAKRMTVLDAKRAKNSQKLRNKEFSQMREKKVVIRGGDYAGKLLADVLREDLMEIAV